MYPISYAAAHVEPHNRLTSFFRLFMVIPLAVVAALWGIAALFCVMVAWFALVFTGRYPEGLYDFVAKFLRFQTRVYAYEYLVTDQYPAFNGDDDPAYPVRVHIDPPKAEYSRMKALFRCILFIPVYFVNYAMQVVAQFGAFAAWFVIMFTGKMPEGLQDAINLGLRYSTRASAYMLLMTEDWPPFSDDRPELGDAAQATALPASSAPAPSDPAAPPELAGGFAPPVPPEPPTPPAPDS